MQIERSFVVDLDQQEVQRRGQAALTTLGYRVVERSGGLAFERGSRLASIVSASPLRFWVEGTLDIAPTDNGSTATIAYVLDWRKIGQFISGPEATFFEAEQGSIEAAVRSGNVPSIDEASVVRLRRQNYIWSTGVISATVVVGVIGFVLFGPEGWLVGGTIGFVASLGIALRIIGARR